jgi:hypothetical protein
MHPDSGVHIFYQVKPVVFSTVENMPIFSFYPPLSQSTYHPQSAAVLDNSLNPYRSDVLDIL